MLLRLGRLDEAERWSRQAAETRPVPGNQCRLAKVLLRLGRLDEAERWARRAAADRPVRERLLVLADVLDRKGKRDEAERLREEARFAEVPVLLPGAAPEVVLVAVASVAVASFVKALMSKAGENSYAGARALLKWLFQRGRARKTGPWRERHNQLLIVEDPDPKLSLAMWLGTDTPDEQLRALKDLDVDSIVTDTRKSRGIRIQWDEASQSWRVLDQ